MFLKWLVLFLKWSFCVRLAFSINPEVPLLQMVKKDENINCLQIDSEESTKQLTIMKGILPKVFGDRDMQWERVKQCSEGIEALEKDLLLKGGQMTILKDWLGNKFF